MGEKEYILTAKQRKAFEFLSFKYGNGGSLHTNENHKFLMLLLKGNYAEALLYSCRITTVCREAYDRILKNDLRELQVNQRGIVNEIKE